MGKAAAGAAKVTWTVQLTKKAENSLRTAPLHIQRKVADLLDTLRETPVPFRSFDTVKLRGYRHVYRVRLGQWRILYELRLNLKSILVYRIEPRERAYE